MNQGNSYDLLIQKLDRFIRKYYVNQLIRGMLYTTALVLVLFLGLNFLEHYYYFPSSTRKLLFYSFIGISAVALGGWVLLPLLRYFRLGKTISHTQAATIIGSHFVDVKDKLLNILQLRDQTGNSPNADLVLASINQKSEQIKLVPFKNAIDLGENRKYLRYALPPLMLLIIILFAAPSLIKDSTNRLIRNNEEFERPAPFSFIVEEDNMEVVQFEDYPLTVKVEGEILPNEVFIDVDNYQYRLTKEEPGVFSYRFSNVQKETDFKLFSSGVESEEFELKVLKKPNILGFDLKLDYPAYTQRKDESLASIGDVVVPAGTNIDWVFNSLNTDNIDIQFAGAKELVETKRFSDDLFTYKKRILRDEAYKLYVSNADLPKADSISYTITVIPDQYPTIKAEKFADSTNAKLLFFAGDAGDDYGLRSLTFNYRIKKEKGQQGELQTTPLSTGNGKNVQYDHTFDLNELALAPGDEVSYYFEVYDNDAVNGSKSARTNLMMYAMPTVDEFEKLEEENENQIKDKLQKSLEESKKVQQDMKKLREKLLQEKELDWQDRKELERLMERQKELQKDIQDAQKSFEENLKNQEEFSKTDENILEKQEKLQEMFEEVMSEEMQELMKQIEEMMQDMEKENALEMMEDMEMNDEELEMELDRMLEMFKQLELENEMEKAIDKLEELAEKQEELSEETEKEENASDEKQEELKEKQEDINKEFDELKEKMDDIEKKNEELENPKDIDTQEEEQEDIEQNLDDSKEQLDQKQNSKASKSQKKAANKMKEMAAAMAQQMQSQEMEQMEEDMQALRQLLENLVGLSFEQEDLIDQINESNINTPRYVDLVQQQYKLKDDFKLVEDSLQALSKRVFQIESFVTEKVTEVKRNMKEGLKDLEERKKPQAATHQQRTMQNVNDLALMLSEVMNQMQQQMSGMMSGDQMCKNPGGKGKKGSKPSDKPGEGQKGINDQMKQMKQAMEQGKGGSSKQFAEMAAKQAALRKALRQKQAEKQKQGKGGSEQMDKILEQMNKTETDLVNKKLTNEMLQRQEEILTRLLEHEKAEREREYDNKRKAESAQQYERKLPSSLEEYIKKRESEIDMYKSVSPNLKPYYKFLVEEYFKSLQN
ncbi:MAG: DUF4175 family protein [Saprospiraceae bacterium]